MDRRRCAHRGPAHSAERSTTKGRWLRPPGRGPPRRSTSTPDRAGTGSPGAEHASPMRRPRATASAVDVTAAQAATSCHAVALARSTRAGTMSTSSTRGSESPHHPSAVSIVRKLPPQDHGPWRRKACSAALSPRSCTSGSAGSVPTRSWTAAASRSIERRAETAGVPGATVGGPSVRPVSAIAPDAAHSRTGPDGHVDPDVESDLKSDIDQAPLRGNGHRDSLCRERHPSRAPRSDSAADTDGTSRARN